MTRAMVDIADGEGDLTKRLIIQNNDEFGGLGTAFNRFVERIHGSIREVSSATRPGQRSRLARGRGLELVDVQLRPASVAHQQRGRGDQPARCRRPGNRPQRRPGFAARPAMRAAWPKTASKWWTAALRR